GSPRNAMQGRASARPPTPVTSCARKRSSAAGQEPGPPTVAHDRLIGRSHPRQHVHTSAPAAPAGAADRSPVTGYWSPVTGHRLPVTTRTHVVIVLDVMRQPMQDDVAEAGFLQQRAGLLLAPGGAEA